MKLPISSFVAVLVFVFALSFPAGAPAAPRTPQPKPSPAAATAEPHPEIRAAMANLREAREHLNHAAHDFHGHRVAAIKAVDEALHQLQLALESDRH